MSGLLLDRATEPRNGHPEFRPYVYRGIGSDTKPLADAELVPYGYTEPDARTWLQPCGTIAAYRRHARHGEPPCADCARANRLHVADRPRKYTVHASHGGKPRCGAVAAQAIAEPGQEVTCKRCLVYAEEAGVKR